MTDRDETIVRLFLKSVSISMTEGLKHADDTVATRDRMIEELKDLVGRMA